MLNCYRQWYETFLTWIEFELFSVKSWRDLLKKIIHLANDIQSISKLSSTILIIILYYVCTYVHQIKFSFFILLSYFESINKVIKQRSTKMTIMWKTKWVKEWKGFKEAKNMAWYQWWVPSCIWDEPKWGVRGNQWTRAKDTIVVVRQTLQWTLWIVEMIIITTDGFQDILRICSINYLHILMYLLCIRNIGLHVQKVPYIYTYVYNIIYIYI